MLNGSNQRSRKFYSLTAKRNEVPRNGWNSQHLWKSDRNVFRFSSFHRFEKLDERASSISSFTSPLSRFPPPQSSSSLPFILMDHVSLLVVSHILFSLPPPCPSFTRCPLWTMRGSRDGKISRETHQREREREKLDERSLSMWLPLILFVSSSLQEACRVSYHSMPWGPFYCPLLSSRY